MAVVSVREIASTRGGDSSGISEIKLSRVFRVKTNSTSDDPTTIFASGLLPALYAAHPNFIYCFAQNASCRQEAPPFFWIVDVEYSSKPIPQEWKDRETYPNPTDRPVRISIKSAQYTRVPTKWIPTDSNGTPLQVVFPVPILNSALDEYDSLVEIDDGRRSLHFVKNYSTPPDWVFTFADVCINSVDAMIADPNGTWSRTCAKRTLKLSGIELSEQMEEQGYKFYQVSFDLQYRVDKWLYTLVDRGFNCFGTASTYSTKKKILSPQDGTPPHVPQLLAGDGTLLNPPTTSGAVLLYGQTFTEVDFNQLPLTF